MRLFPSPGSFGSLLLLYACFFHAAAQSAGVNQAGPDYIHAPAGANPIAPGTAPASSSPVERMRQAERRRHILTDTEKIFQLSSEIKALVERTPADQLSLELTRKAAELEKTARDLKQWTTL